MKHNQKITYILLSMFIITQFLGLYVVGFYSSPENPLPYGLEVPAAQNTGEYTSYFSTIIFAFILAILIFVLLTKLKLALVLKIWFFLVVWIALGLSLNSIIPINKFSTLIALILALPLVISKVYQKNMIMHNVTELLIYPGIAAVFVPILNIATLIGFLILISVYDIWAVWKSGLMQKMAKYQIKEVGIFSGFFIPYMSKTMRAKIKKMKKSELKKKKIKVNIALLGGGDVVFPIITSGVLMALWGLGPALLSILGATLGLSYLFFMGKKKKFYPAMPFITAGILISMIISYFIF